MNKVLIFGPYSCQINDGGPSGFIAHNLLGKHSEVFDLKTLRDINLPNGIFEKIRRQYWKFFSKQSYAEGKFNDFSFIREVYKEVNSKSYPIVYFHDVFTLYFCLPEITKNQKIILQTHSPELPHEEMVGQESEKIIEWARNAEKQAFKRADYIVFPNEGVVPIYKRLLDKNAKILFLVSGAKPVKENGKIPLDETTVNFLYIGRRNRVKGFDLIIDGFKLAYEKNPSIKLFLLGKGNVIEHPAIIDIGFSTRQHLWINSVDYVLNANRQSYFDLSIIETLSIGTPLVMSTNFGHKYFKDSNLPGIIDLGDQSDITKIADAICNSKIKKYNNMDAVEANRLFFDKNLNANIYLNSLENLLTTIL